MKYLFLALSFLFCTSIKAQDQINHIVEIETNLGNMRFKLYNDTPKHRDAFMQLAREGYYNETLFYRVIENFLIQGGSRSSRNAPPGKRIGYGSPDHTVDDEIIPGHIHKKGALCAPRQPDEVNPFKQSDISQFYIIEGQVFTEGQLDTMEIAVNRPIHQKVVKEVYTPEIKAQLKKLKAENKVAEFREIADKVKSDIAAKMKLNPNTLEFTEQQRKTYTTVGGYPDLDGKYTIFGECILGFDVIDKISKLKTDENNRPYTDVKITVKIIQ